MHSEQLNKAIENYSSKLLDSAYKRLEEALPNQKDAVNTVILALKAELKEELSAAKSAKSRRAAARSKNPDAPKRKPSAYNLFMKAQMDIEKAKGANSAKQPEMMSIIAKRWQEEKARLAAAAK